MQLSNKIKVLYNAFRQTNKTKLLKNVCLALRSGGVFALKEGILRASSRAHRMFSTAPVYGENLYSEQCAESYVSNDDGRKPQIAVILYIPDGDYYYIDSLRSIEAQKYENLDLIIAVFKEEPLREDIEPSYKVIFCRESFGYEICSIISGLTSEVVCILKAGDTLPPHSLERYADAISAGDSVVYADEAIWDFGNSNPVRYVLKPDFSRFYELTNSYIGKAVCCKCSVFKGLLSDLRLQENYPLFMRKLGHLVSEGKEKPGHIERILLLRHSEYVKNEPVCGVEDSSDFSVPSLKVSLIIQVTKPSDAILCARSIKSASEVFFLFDREKCDMTEVLEAEADFKCKLIPVDGTQSRSAQVNIAAEQISGDVLVIVQDYLRCDVGNVLKEIIMCFRYDFVGAVSPKVLREDGTIRYAGAIVGAFDFSSPPFCGELDRRENTLITAAFVSRETSVLSESCFAVRTKLWRDLGGLDSERFPSKFAALDLAFRVRKMGFSTVFCAQGILSAHGGDWYDSAFLSFDKKGYLSLMKKWGIFLERDPFFTESMKRVYLRNIPLDFRFFHGMSQLPNHHGRNILLVSHELTRTGAPVALYHMAKALLDNGDFPFIVSPSNGNLRSEITGDGIPVLIDRCVADNDMWINYASNFDMVVVCTLVNVNAIKSLEKAKIPTLWWAHEAQASYEIGALNTTLPYSVKANIHVYCGGEYARKVLIAHRPAYEAGILLYEVPDFSDRKIDNKALISFPDHKFVFSIIGSIMERKGQDIFAEAIEKLPRTDRERCIFLFVGSRIDNTIYDKVLRLKKRYPDDVILVDEVNRMELMHIYRRSDCVVCSSRDDPMPIFMAEAMMFSKVCICSENTGTADLLRDGVNGYVYSGNSSTRLMEKMSFVLNHARDLDDMRQASRRTYEDYFTENAFIANMNNIIANIIENRER